MIKSPHEFQQLYLSEEKEKQDRIKNDEASIETWLEIIENYPSLKSAVILNKNLPHEILSILASDQSEEIRSEVAFKRKIHGTKIFEKLAKDVSEDVRYSLACNTKNKKKDLLTISSEGSEWFKERLEEKIKRTD